MKGRYFTGLSSYIAMAELDVPPENLNAAYAVRISEKYVQGFGKFRRFCCLIVISGTDWLY
jgi:hypothetical protein